MKKHFVTFYSPGTFVHEDSSFTIDSWDIEVAKDMAHGIVERHGATPFGFKFTTRSRGDGDLDSKVSATSPMYYLGGKIETRDEVEARNSPDEKILRLNMKSNNIERIIVNDNSYRSTHALQSTDVVLDWTPRRKK